MTIASVGILIMQFSPVCIRKYFVVLIGGGRKQCSRKRKLFLYGAVLGQPVPFIVKLD